MFDKYTLVKTNFKDIPEGVPVYGVPILYTTSFPKGMKNINEGVPVFVRQEDLQVLGGWTQEDLDSMKESTRGNDISTKNLDQNTLDFPEDDR